MLPTDDDRVPPASPSPPVEGSRWTEAAARVSYGRVLAFLSSRTRDIAAAEDALQDAMASALRTWPRDGVPENPDAWILTAARRRLIDGARAERARRRFAGRAAAGATAFALPSEDEPMTDERLCMLFACAHPAVEAQARTALLLQCVLGLDAGRIAPVFLVTTEAMTQRLVRAKRKIRDAGIAFVRPEPAERPARLAVVLEAVYAAFTAGWDDPAAGESAPPAAHLSGAASAVGSLCEEAVWLGRVLADLCPEEPEVLGLLSLMLHCHARRGARRTGGTYVPLSAQSPTAWDHAMIDEAESLLARASASGVMGQYQLEAAAQSVHAARRHSGRSDWAALLRIYDALIALAPSLGARVARAAAVAEHHGLAGGIAELDRIADSDAQRIVSYQPYWAARGMMLIRAQGASGEGLAEARDCLTRAAGLTADPAVREFLSRACR